MIVKNVEKVNRNYYRNPNQLYLVSFFPTPIHPILDGHSALTTSSQKEFECRSQRPLGQGKRGNEAVFV